MVRDRHGQPHPCKHGPMSIPEPDDPRWREAGPSEPSPEVPRWQPESPSAPGELAPQSAPVTLASFGQRVLARLIDLLIVGLPSLVLIAVFSAGAVSDIDLSAVTADPETGQPADPEAFSQAIAELSGVALTWSLIVFAIWGIYEVGLTATRGATLGKSAMRIAVLDQGSFGLISWGRSSVRWAIPAAVGFVCGPLQLLIYLSPLFDSSRRLQGWHDKAARDLVVRRLPAQAATPSP